MIIDENTYTVQFEAKGKFIKEVYELTSDEDRGLAYTMAKCLSFYRRCKEIEDRGGELRCKLDGKTYKMKLP